MPKNTPERIIDRKRSGDGYYTPGPERTPVAGPDGLIALEWIPQGEGSGLNSDMVDGLHASAFAPVDHLHDNRYSQLDHNHDNRYSQLDHNHDARYAALYHTHSLIDLDDVEVTSSSDGDVLTYNSNLYKWVAATHVKLPNTMFAHVTLPAGYSNYYNLIHQYKTLRLHFLKHSSSSSLRVYYGATLVYESSGSGETIADVNLFGFGFVVGNFYTVQLHANGEDAITVYFMAEIADYD